MKPPPTPLQNSKGDDHTTSHRLSIHSVPTCPQRPKQVACAVELVGFNVCPQTTFNLRALGVVAPQQFRSSIELHNCILDRVHDKRHRYFQVVGFPKSGTKLSTACCSCEK